MAQYYKRGSLGMMVKAEGGDSDPDLAEVRLTVDEYADMRKRISAAERATKEAEAEGRRREDAVYELANKQLAQYCEEADQEADRKVKAAERAQRAAEQAAVQAQRVAEQKVAKAESMVEAMRTEVERANHLNVNLKRIARERANAARGITPKKNHDGYLVMNSRQWTEKYLVDEWDTDAHKEEYGGSDEMRTIAFEYGYLKTVKKTADVWKSVIQTPHDASLPLNQIKDIIIEDEMFNGGVLDSIGCCCKIKEEYNGNYYSFGTNEDGYEKNGLYKWKFVANYKSGFWEVEIFTTKSLKVPEYRRPPKR